MTLVARRSAGEKKRSAGCPHSKWGIRSRSMNVCTSFQPLAGPRVVSPMPRRVQISSGSGRRQQRGRRPEAPRTTPLARLPALRQPRSASPASRATDVLRSKRTCLRSPPTCDHLPLAIGSHEQLRCKPPQSGQALASPIVLLLACAMQRRLKATWSAISAPARGAVSEPCPHSATSTLAVLPGALLSAESRHLERMRSGKRHGQRALVRARLRGTLDDEARAATQIAGPAAGGFGSCT